MTELERKLLLDNLDIIEKASERIALYLGPSEWRDWDVDAAVADAREALGCAAMGPTDATD